MSDLNSKRECSKKARCLTRPARARQDLPILWQDRRRFDARTVQAST
ncbi:MAG: hypothetical protein V3U07_04345 [Nitrospirales bacterium]